MRHARTLKDVREKLLGFGRGFAAARIGISEERLAELESGAAEPSVFELESMSDLYGIDADLLAEEPIILSPGDGVEVFTSLDEFRELNDVTRHRIVQAANAARDLVRLLEYREADRRADFAKEAAALRLPHVSRDGVPYKQSRDLAIALRHQWGLARQPIPSLRELIREQFPSLAVLYADLGPHGPAGLSFADPLRGPAIVINLRGKNENPLVRRFSLAHELCHLLVDWNKQEPLAMISGYFTDSGLDKEQRANAFAVRFLCPESSLRDLTESGDLPRLLQFGLPYTALRLYARNEAGPNLPPMAPPSMSDAWHGAEKPLGLREFPLDRVPPERRTIIAELAAQLYSEGIIARDEFAEYLKVPPTEELHRVLDFFALDAPADSSEPTAA